MKRKNIDNFNNKNWTSSWYAYNKEYSILLQEDIIIYIYIRSLLFNNKLQSFIGFRLYKLNRLFIIDIYSLFSCLFIGRGLIVFMNKVSAFFNRSIFLTINRLFFLDLSISGFFIAYKISKFIEKGIRFRSKVIKILLKQVKRNCKGVYALCKGRISNTDIASNDKLYIGSNPLQSINLFVSYGKVIANTIKGLQCIKVWVSIN